MLLAQGATGQSIFSTGTFWGGVKGTLSSQTDLQSALDLKGSLTGTQTWSGLNTFNASLNTVLAINNTTLNTGSTSLEFRNNGIMTNKIETDINQGTIKYNNATGYYPVFYSSGVEAMRIPWQTRNLLINTTTDSGEKLQVNGTSKFVGNLTNTTGDIEILDSAKGIILKSPDGTRYRVKVANGGILTVTAL